MPPSSAWGVQSALDLIQTGRMAGSDSPRVDATLRYGIPHPLSVLYQLVRANRHDAIAEVTYSLRLFDALLRFLATTQIADAVHLGAPPKKTEGWCRDLMRAPLGSLLSIVKEASKWLDTHEHRFLRDCPGIRSEDWLRRADELVRLRNEYVHDYKVEPVEARYLRPQFRSLLQDVVGVAAEFAGIQLGYFDRPTAEGGGTFQRWCPAIGLEQRSAAVRLEISPNAPPFVPALLDVHRGELLFLCPLWQVLSPAGLGGQRLLWVLDGRVRAKRAPSLTYGDPEFAAIREPHHPDNPSSIEPVPVTIQEFVDNPSEWPGRRTLGLDEEAQALLRDRWIPPEVGPGYELRSELGTGGMATVWEAYDRSLDRRVALKRPRPEFQPDAAWMQRFVREGQALAKISHPGVVAVHLLGEDLGGTPFLVMELADGENFEQWLDRLAPEPPPLPEALAAMREVLEALQAVHEQGVLHRDVKPANFMRTATGVRMIDFGIAHFLGGHRYTQVGMTIGTPGYTAPEQAQGKPEVTSDVYGAGALFLSLLTGSMPNGEEDWQNGPRLQEQPEPLRSVVQTAMSFHADDRFQDARSMLEALCDAQAELFGQRVDRPAMVKVPLAPPEKQQPEVRPQQDPPRRNPFEAGLRVGFCLAKLGHHALGYGSRTEAIADLAAQHDVTPQLLELHVWRFSEAIKQGKPWYLRESLDEAYVHTFRGLSKLEPDELRHLVRDA